MRNLISTMLSRLMLVMAAVLALTSCSCERNEEPSKSNSYVTTFTTGTISRFADVYLILSEDVPDSVIKEVDLNKIMSISPSIDGVFSFADNHTILFRHTDSFERNAKYQVSAKLSKLFSKAVNEEKNFVFEFMTMPLSLSCDFAGLEQAKDELNYILNFNVRSTDLEDSTLLLSEISASEGEIEWNETGMSNSHSFKLTAKGQNASHDVAILSTSFDTLCVATIPGLNEINVYDVVYKTDENTGQTYAEVTFSKNLSTKQNMEGLIYIENNQNTTVDVTGNKARLYPDATQSSITVVISGTVKSAKGITLGADERHTVNLKTSKPSVEFDSEKTIIPLTDNISIPFESVAMKGIRVRVFKVFKNNMQAFIQSEQLDTYGRLAQFGEPVAVKTIYFDEKGNNLMQWHTYAIDLTNIMKAEKGTLYRVELQMDKDLSAWPGVENANFDKTELAKKDARILKQLKKDFNSGNMWYSTDEGWYGDDVDDPTKEQYYKEVKGRNVLATNIGITALSAGEGKMRVFVLNLPDAAPRKGIDINVYSVQNQLIGTYQTDDKGIADITYDANDVRPYYIIASSGDDMSYLRLANGENLSTSTFDVGGETIQDGVKCFLYGERGVWRPGDIIHLAAIVQSARAALPDNHPVTMELYTPLGILYKTVTATDGKNGMYTFNIQTDANDPTGTWVAKATVGSATFSKNIKIETIKPNRLKIDLGIPEQLNVEGTEISLHTEWLTGANSGKLHYQVETSMLPTKTTFAKYQDYCFDDPTRSKFKMVDEYIKSDETDNDGNAKFTYKPWIESNAPGKLKVSLTTRVFEPSGEFSTDVSTAVYSPFARYVGIKSPQKSGSRQLDTGKSHKFNVVCVDANGKPLADVKLKVDIYKVSWWWWWSSSIDNEIANYTSNTWCKPDRDYTITTQKDGTASFTHSVDRDDWGVYLMEVTDIEKGHTTGTLAYFDWPEMTSRNDSEYNSATKLYVSTDKSEYNVGDSIKVTFPSSKGSKAIVNICRGTSIVSSQLVNCGSGKTSVSVLATDEMRPNVYAVVSLVQPYFNSKSDSPIRLYGIARAKVTSATSHLYPQVAAKDEVRPEQKMSVTVSEKSGRAMSYTLAVVDEGLLDLTHFKTPSPWGTFNATEAFGMKIWDMYNHVAGAYGGKIERMFSIGGDEYITDGYKSVVNRFTPMVYFGGPFTLEKGEKKTHSIDVPNYTGRVRVMVVASDGSAVGEAEKSVKVTKPLMLLGTLPRQIGVGDKSTVSATVFTNKAMGNVTVTIKAKDGVKVVGESKKTVTINSASNAVVNFQIEAGNAEGEAMVSLTCSAKGESADYTTKLKVRKEVTTVAHTEDIEIKPGASWTSKKYTFDPTSTVGNTMLELSCQKPLNLSGRAEGLIRYPHGCAEQTTSKVLSQLYLSEFSDLNKEQRNAIDEYIKAGISKLTRHATSSGGMAYWEGGSYPSLRWSAYVYTFFTEAEAKGYYIESSVKSRLESYLRKEVRSCASDEYTAPSIAFALYALANANIPESGAMNRLKETLPGINVRDNYHYYYWGGHPVQEAYNWLAAAYACAGTKSVAKDLAFKGAEYEDLPTRLLTLCRIGDQNAKTVAEQIRQKMVNDKEWMSTYETGLSIMAWHHFAKNRSQGFQTKGDVTIDGATESISTGKMAWTKTLAEGKLHTVKITNTGSSDLNVMMTTQERAAQSDIPANANGLKVALTGMPKSAKAGATFKTTVTVMNASGNDYENVAVSFIVPAGVEIMNVDDEFVSNVDIRDDRVYAYIDEFKAMTATKFEVTLSATYAGDYYFPVIDARLMYNDKVQGNTASGRFVIE